MPYNQKAAVLLFSNHLFSGANKLFFSSFGYLNINFFCVRGSFSPVDFLYLFFAEFHRPSRHPLPCEAQRVLVSWQRTFFRSKKTHEISLGFFCIVGRLTPLWFRAIWFGAFVWGCCLMILEAGNIICFEYYSMIPLNSIAKVCFFTDHSFFKLAQLDSPLRHAGHQ